MKKIFILIMCFLLCSCTKDMPAFNNVVIDMETGNSSKLRLSMVGDAMIHASLFKDALDDGKYDFSKMFSLFSSEIEDSDLIYYNQETIIGGDNLGFYGYPNFNTPSNFAKAMITLGFNVVSRANNHALDQGEKGLINSCNFWNKYSSVLTNGSACTKDERDNPRILEKNGIRYTMLSYTTVESGSSAPEDYYLSVYSDELVKRDIEHIEDQTDVILVAMHWGDEYADTPNEEQKRIAKYLASLGVDVVVGTHPHTIEPIEWIDDTLVIYSLGNFISGQDKSDDYNKRIGLLAHVDIVKTTYNDEVNIELKNLETELLYTHSVDSRDYKVVPFSKMDDSILSGYKSKEIKYEAIVKKYDSSIKTRTSS